MSEEKASLALMRQAINHIIRYWSAAGDDSPAAELVPDAFLHIRWRMEEFKRTPAQAARDTLAMRIP